MFQILVDLQFFRLGGFRQAIDNRTSFGTVDGINDVPVGPSNGEGMDRTFRCGIVNRDIAILQEYLQVLLLANAEKTSFFHHRTVSEYVRYTMIIVLSAN